MQLARDARVPGDASGGEFSWCAVSDGVLEPGLALGSKLMDRIGLVSSEEAHQSRMENYEVRSRDQTGAAVVGKFSRREAGCCRRKRLPRLHGLGLDHNTAGQQVPRLRTKQSYFVEFLRNCEVPTCWD